MNNQIPFITDLAHPHTHWPYYTKRLACWWVLDAPRFQPAALYVGQGKSEPVIAYRLTPTSFVWFFRAVEALGAQADKDAARIEIARWATNQLAEMELWLANHGLGPDVSKAMKSPKVQLPELPVFYDDRVRKADASFNARTKTRDA